MSSANPGRATPIALIDLGDTLADCTPALQARLAELADSEKRGAGETPAALAMRLDRRRSAILATPGFWRDLAPRPQGLALLELLRGAGFAVHVVTKGPYEAPQVWADKVAWCRAHVPDVPVVVCDDKSRVHGHVLIDDWLPYVERWQRQWPDGLAIIPAQPWNSDAPASFADRCVRFDGSGGKQDAVVLRWLRERLIELRGS
jgi:5'(3')-deoxyribonucleotidase